MNYRINIIFAFSILAWCNMFPAQARGEDVPSEAQTRLAVDELIARRKPGSSGRRLACSILARWELSTVSFSRASLNNHVITKRAPGFMSTPARHFARRLMQRKKHPARPG